MVNYAPNNSNEVTVTIRSPTPPGPTAYTITVVQAANGVITPGTTVVNAGDSETFTVTPDAGYRITHVVVDGDARGADTSYTFFNVQAAHTITATFVGTSPPPPGGLSNMDITLIAAGVTGAIVIGAGAYYATKKKKSKKPKWQK